MPFQVWKKPSHGKKEILTSLKNRLETSTYESDIIEALESIYVSCFDYPELVIEICFESIIKSLRLTEDCIIQVKILQVLSFTNIKKQIEILQNTELRAIILSKQPFLISIFIKIFNYDPMINFLIQEPNFNEKIMEMIDSGYFREVELLIKSKTILKETLVFEGIIERIFETRSNKLPQTEEAKNKLLLEIVTNSIKNQYYFIFNCLDLLNLNDIDLDIISCCLNPLSKYFPEIQIKLWIPEFLARALSVENYRIIYFLIYSNQIIFDQFIEKYLNLKKLTEDVDKDIWAFKIFEFILKYTTFKIDNLNSFRINTLLFNLGLDYEILELSADINIDQVIYMIFISSNIEKHNISTDPNNYSEPISSFMVLYNLVNNSNLKLSETQIIEHLVYLRKYLVEHEITLDSIRDQLVITVNQFLNDRSICFEKKSYNITEVKPVKPQENQKVENSIHNDRKIIDDVKNNLFGLLDKFKQKSFSEKKNFDL